MTIPVIAATDACQAIATASWRRVKPRVLRTARSRRRRLTEATGLINLVRQLGGSFGTAVMATLLERGITTADARLVTHANPANTWFTTMRQQLTALMIQRGPADTWTAQHRALATINGLISQQATLLSFERCFQVLALLTLVMLVIVPALPRRPARRDLGAPTH